MPPFFTIITATRNAASTLPHLLDSLAGQTCRDFELILQDGASSDATLSLAESYRERLPALSAVSEPDSGVYDAWNKALPRVQGKWVLFLGADDVPVGSDVLERCKASLEAAAASVRYAVGGVALCGDQGEVVTAMPGRVDGVAAHLPKGYAPFWQNGLFHRAELFAAMRFDGSLRIFGDYDFICRTWSDAAAVHLPFTVAAVSLGGISNSPSRLVEARLEALRVSQRYFGKRHLPGLCLGVAKACVAHGVLALLGPERGIRALNVLRTLRGLPPTWKTPEAAVQPIAQPTSQPTVHPAVPPSGPPIRRLNKGYLYRNTIAMAGCMLADNILRLLPIRKRRFPEQVRSILIIKPDHLGDLLLMGSVLPLITELFPGSSIDLVTSKWAMPVAVALPGIRDIFEVNHWVHNRTDASLRKKLWDFCCSFWKTLRALRARRYDLCLCLRSFGGNLISLGRLSGAGYLAGHGTGGLGPLLDAEARWQEGAHETEHFLEVLTLCGISRPDAWPLFYPPLSGADPQRCEQVRQQLGIPAEYIVIFPCSGEPKRMFPPDYWRKMIAIQPEDCFVVSSSASEKQAALAVVRDFSNAIVAAGDFSLPDLALFLGGAKHIHTVDSFGAHLAGASGTPVTVHCRPDGADMRQFIPLGERVRLLPAEIPK